MPTEVPATLKLYLDGKMEQFWLRDNNKGVIFLMTVDSVEEADALLKAMPLGGGEPSDLRADASWTAHPAGMLITQETSLKRAVG